MNDDLPVMVGHYIWDHGLEGGQGVFRLFIDLSLNFAPHEITKGLQSFELGGQISLDQWSFRLAFSQSWGSLAMFWVARPQNSLSLWGQKTFFVLILSWYARFPWTSGPSGWPSASPGWFWHCFGWPGHKIHCLCEAKDIFCFNFGQEWHLPTQQPGFGSKHSSKGKPGTCALFRNLAISCWFLPARKSFRTVSQVLYSTLTFL